MIALAWHNADPDLWQASLPAIIAFAGWAVASHAFTSIQDIEADRAGGIQTVATFLGARTTAWFALAGYCVAVGAAAQYGLVWGAIVAVYPVLVAWYMLQPSRERANQLYRFFIALNSVLGFFVTVYLAVSRPAHTVWAAVVVVALVVLVIGSLSYARYTARPIVPTTGASPY